MTANRKSDLVHISFAAAEDLAHVPAGKRRKLIDALEWAAAKYPTLWVSSPSRALIDRPDYQRYGQAAPSATLDATRLTPDATSILLSSVNAEERLYATMFAAHDRRLKLLLLRDAMWFSDERSMPFIDRLATRRLYPYVSLTSIIELSTTPQYADLMTIATAK